MPKAAYYAIFNGLLTALLLGIFMDVNHDADATKRLVIVSGVMTGGNSALALWFVRKVLPHYSQAVGEALILVAVPTLVMFFATAEMLALYVRFAQGDIYLVMQVIAITDMLLFVCSIISIFFVETLVQPPSWLESAARRK